MIRPIRPSEVAAAKADPIPDEVIDIFNELITEKWNGWQAVVPQDEVVERVCAKLSIDRKQVFDRQLIAVKGLFEFEGWVVTYNAGNYHDPEPPTFTFTEKK